MASIMSDRQLLTPRAGLRRGLNYAGIIFAVGVTYFVLAMTGLTLASIHPSATPIWPPTGFALAAILLWGSRTWPAIFLAAMIANAMTAGSIATAIAIAAGNTLEGLVGAHLINRWSNGRDTFAAPNAVAKFALICVAAATPISATIGVGSLTLAGFAEWANFRNIWITWWLGDATGALVVTPVIVLWALSDARTFDRNEVAKTAAVMSAAIAVGLIAFSPVFEQTTARDALGFLAILPLLWAALRRGPRDTATTALILAGFTVWGTLAGGGPFASQNLNDSFLLVLMFVISISVPSLALSADVSIRKRTEESLRSAHAEVDRKVELRTAELADANRALKAGIEQQFLMETELEQQRVHLLEAQRLANLGSWAWEVTSNRVTWSDQLFEIYGVQPGEFQHRFEDFLACVHPDDRERVKEQIYSAYQSGHGFQLEERIVRPNGEVRHLQSCGEVIKDAHGKVVRLLGICQDVTDRKQSEAALETARDQLSQAQKLEALGQLTGGVSHDFNNLLMIIGGHTQLLRRHLGASDGKVAQALGALETAAKRGENLTRQLLAFSRRQKLNPTVVVLRDRIEAIRGMLGSSLRGNISFVCDIPANVWRIEIDVAELELAMVNVAVNARDAMPEGGTFTLRAQNVDLQSNTNAARLDGEFVALSMTDTGVGIPGNIRLKIFEPFFTTKLVGKGTGLGLSQVYGFATQSGGAVTVTSEVGTGTTIMVFLPRSHGALRHSEERPESSIGFAGEGTVLVVEDNPDVAEVTASLLEQLGYRVLHAENADDALGKLQGGQKFKFVLSDIVMPGGMNGIDLAHEIKRHYPEIPILLTSGYSEAAQAAETSYIILRKPFELSVLEKAIQEITPHHGQPA